MVWSAHADGNPREGDRVAEHAYAADRFAREIVGFLKVIGGALAAADRQPVGRAHGSVIANTYAAGDTDTAWI